MADPEPVLVQEENTGSFGLYHPDEDVIETYIGNDREELPGAYLDENWHEAPEADLQESIEADIEDVRKDIDELRSKDLTDDQEQELNRLELRLAAQVNVFELAKEVTDGDD